MDFITVVRKLLGIDDDNMVVSTLDLNSDLETIRILILTGVSVILLVSTIIVVVIKNWDLIKTKLLQTVLFVKTNLRVVSNSNTNTISLSNAIVYDIKEINDIKTLLQSNITLINNLILDLELYQNLVLDKKKDILSSLVHSIQTDGTATSVKTQEILLDLDRALLQSWTYKEKLTTIVDLLENFEKQVKTLEEIILRDIKLK
jgi:hypothetical protein